MKYLSVLLFGSAFAWSWNLIYEVPVVGIQTHSGIQSNLAKLIVQAVKNKRANSRDITILKLRTEEGQNGEIFASFQYRYSEGEGDGNSIITTTSGIATLAKASDNKDGEDRWNLKKVQMIDDSLVFDDPEKISTGTDVTPNEGATKDVTPPTPSPEPTKE